MSTQLLEARFNVLTDAELIAELAAAYDEARKVREMEKDDIEVAKAKLNLEIAKEPFTKRLKFLKDVQKVITELCKMREINLRVYEE